MSRLTLEDRIARLESLTKNEASRRNVQLPQASAMQLCYFEELKSIINEIRNLFDSQLRDYCSRLQEICYALDAEFKADGNMTDRQSRLSQAILKAAYSFYEPYKAATSMAKPLEMVEREFGIK